MAAVASYPELSCTPEAVNYQVISGEPFIDWSTDHAIALQDNTLCPANEKVYTFLDKVFGEVAELFPRTQIVLNHTGFPWDRSAEGLKAWRVAMERIARCSNVWLKVSEFGLKDKPWSYSENQVIVQDALSIFGIERCMFASNFPVASLRIDFNTLVNSVAKMINGYSAKQQQDFFVNNAAKFYRLDTTTSTLMN
jgi:predicted TIM-barrel fold metal-dependent hydrolase